MKRRVVITGLGVISPIGNNTKKFWESLCAGISGIGPITHFDATGFDSRIAGEVNDFDTAKYLSPKEIKRADRFTQFAIAFLPPLALNLAAYFLPKQAL